MNYTEFRNKTKVFITLFIWTQAPKCICATQITQFVYELEYYLGAQTEASRFLRRSLSESFTSKSNSKGIGATLGVVVGISFICDLFPQDCELHVLGCFAINVFQRPLVDLPYPSTRFRPRIFFLSSKFCKQHCREKAVSQSLLLVG